MNHPKVPSFAHGEYFEKFAPYIKPNCLVAFGERGSAPKGGRHSTYMFDHQ